MAVIVAAYIAKLPVGRATTRAGMTKEPMTREQLAEMILKETHATGESLIFTALLCSVR